MTEDQIKSLQSTGGDHLAATEKNILGNHLGQLWETVKEIRNKTGGRIDFVLVSFCLYTSRVYSHLVRIMLDLNCTVTAFMASIMTYYLSSLTEIS